MKSRMYGVPDPRDASGPPPEHHDNSDDNGVCDRVRSAYVRARRRALKLKDGRESKWDGGTDNAGRKHKPVWEKIAAWLEDHEIADWDAYMAAQFVNGRLRQPTELCTPKAIERYKEFIAASAAMVAQRLKGDTLRFRDAVDDARFSHPDEDKRTLWYLALTSQLADLSPLFRYCLAVSESWDALASEFQGDAVAQFQRHPVLYRQHWATVIPADFYQLAEQAKT